MCCFAVFTIEVMGVTRAGRKDSIKRSYPACATKSENGKGRKRKGGKRSERKSGTGSQRKAEREAKEHGTGTAVAAGYYYTCALLSTGHIDCWGYNSSGQLGNGTVFESDIAVEVSGITDATQVTAGEHHTCALLSTGHVGCWDYNYYGQLGDGATTESATPVEVSGII